jgi:hypothetical protein
MKKYAAALETIGLLALSAVIYGCQIILFRDSRDTAFYLLQDWAFLPVQIAVVTIAVGKISGEREKRERISKTKMLASSFFSELGDELLRRLLRCAPDLSNLASALQIQPSWRAAEFRAAASAVERGTPVLRCGAEDLEDLRALLQRKRLELLVIASNPALLEHEEFTDMLWAVFHLTDELGARESLQNLPEADAEHLNLDAERVLRALLVNWLCNMDHVRAEYPYLFAMELGRSPFAQKAG